MKSLTVRASDQDGNERPYDGSTHRRICSNKISRAVLTHLKSACPLSDGRQGKYGATSGTYGAYCAAPGMAPTAANGAVAAALTSGWATRTVAQHYSGVLSGRTRSTCSLAQTLSLTLSVLRTTVQTATALAPQAARAFSPGK